MSRLLRLRRLRHAAKATLIHCASLAAVGCIVYDEGLKEGNGQSVSPSTTGGTGSSGDGGETSGGSSTIPVSSTTGGNTPTGSTGTAAAGGEQTSTPTGGGGTTTGSTGGGSTTGTAGGGSVPGGGMGGEGGTPVTSTAGTISSGNAGGEATGGGGTSTGGGGGGSTAIEENPLIDDMEDGNSGIYRAESRNGFWFTFNDGDGTQTPEQGATFTMTDITRDDSTRCARSVATGAFSDFGAGLGFDLVRNAAYDVSKYSGITFWARNDTATPVTLSFATESTEPVAGTPAFEYQLTLDDTWQEITVMFDDLELSSWFDNTDGSIVWNPAEVLKIQFKTGSGDEHDIYIDDIYFVE